jgi:hypothetical protein
MQARSFWIFGVGYLVFGGNGCIGLGVWDLFFPSSFFNETATELGMGRFEATEVLLI